MSGSEFNGRWGIFGGRFDPVHLGHLMLARDCLRLKKLDGVLLVPSYQPPHKPEDCEASFDDRIHMLKLAVGDDAAFRISDIERTIEGPGYSLRVVRELKRQHPETSFLFIIGADNIDTISTWHKPEELLQEVPFVAGVRPGNDPEALLRFGLPIEMLPTSEIDISGEKIRAGLKAGAGRTQLVKWMPVKVADYILERKLYQP
ncbi:nicotinate (nicotinamide) nucleotide adenylyltransferase [bacterium]|nr:nicotinate (nicotinamide) nucleotide adenylyltransferase [bacterium]MCB2202005.1 nicotinate (nicotinamide) nucleotide adenylyltransferase [bacterium]